MPSADNFLIYQSTLCGTCQKPCTDTPCDSVVCDGPGHPMEVWHHKKCCLIPVDKKTEKTITLDCLYFFCDVCRPLVNEFLAAKHKRPSSPNPRPDTPSPASELYVDLPESPTTPTCTPPPLIDLRPAPNSTPSPTLPAQSPPKPTDKPSPSLPSPNPQHHPVVPQNSPTLSRVPTPTNANLPPIPTTAAPEPNIPPGAGDSATASVTRAIRNVSATARTCTSTTHLFVTNSYPHEAKRKDRMTSQLQYLSHSNTQGTLFIGDSHLRHIESSQSYQVLSAGGLCVPALTEALLSSATTPHKNFRNVYVCLGSNDIMHGKTAHHPVSEMQPWITKLHMALRRLFPSARFHFVTPFCSRSVSAFYIDKLFNCIQSTKLFTLHRSPVFQPHQFRDETHLGGAATATLRAFLHRLSTGLQARSHPPRAPAHSPQGASDHLTGIEQPRMGHLIPPLMSLRTRQPVLGGVGGHELTYAQVAAQHRPALNRPMPMYFSEPVTSSSTYALPTATASAPAHVLAASTSPNFLSQKLAYYIQADPELRQALAAHIFA